MEYLFPVWWSLIPPELTVVKISIVYCLFKFLNIYFRSKLNDIDRDAKFKDLMRNLEERTVANDFCNRFGGAVELFVRENHARYSYDPRSHRKYINRFFRWSKPSL